MVRKYLTENPSREIDSIISQLDPDKVLIVTDFNVKREVLPKLSQSKVINNSNLISLKSGEEGKNVDSVIDLWRKLEEIGATRSSVVINIGGGVITDIGGFAAATFKRGIRTVNFPTTLLGAVDAATGGKTGIDFMGLKNEIGAFHMPSKVIISTLPFSTLPKEEILSGYAEMVKTALISDKNFYIRLLEMDKVLTHTNILGESVEKCVVTKDEVVKEDPQEKGLRKILNFGHTAGHAFESLRIDQNKPVTHGKAVAHGMLVALILSHFIFGLDSTEVHYYVSFLKNHYGGSLIDCRGINEVISKMNSDKKNRKHGEPTFTLLKEIGVPEINITPTRKELDKTLEMYLDLMG